MAVWQQISHCTESVLPLGSLSPTEGPPNSPIPFTFSLVADKDTGLEVKDISLVIVQ